MINKIVFSGLAVLLFIIMGCKSGKINQTRLAEVGMFKITIFYPSGEGKNFDMEYYINKHMPMVAGFLGRNLNYYEIDKGISGRSANEKPLYVAVGYFYVTDTIAYNTAIGQNRQAIVGDFKNYTNIQPVVQISEVVQLKRN